MTREIYLCFIYAVKRKRLISMKYSQGIKNSSKEQLVSISSRTEDGLGTMSAASTERDLAHGDFIWVCFR